MDHPHNDEAERSVLAAILNDQDGTLTDKSIADGLKPESFFDWQKGMILSAVIRLRSKDIIPSVVTLAQDLSGTAELDKVGGATALVSLVNENYSLSQFPSHLEMVLCLACQRQAMAQSEAVKAVLNNDYMSRDELRSAIIKPLGSIENIIQAQAKVRTVDDMIRDVAKKAKSYADGTSDGRDLIYTGIPEFDKWAEPLERHEFCIIAARPGRGKSSLARQIAWHNIKMGKNVLAFLLETSDCSFIEGAAAIESGIGIKQLKGSLPNHQQRFYDALSTVRSFKNNFRVYDKDNTMDAITTRCRVARAAMPIGLVVIDYIQICRGRNPKLSTADAIGEITGSMLSLVKLLGCPVIAMSQLSRDQEKASNRQPVLSDLRDSGSLEADASRVVFIHKPTKDRNGIDQLDDVTRSTFHCELFQAKHREGPICNIKVDFHAPTTTFRDKQ